jgi:hypothetical protein
MQSEINPLPLTDARSSRPLKARPKLTEPIFAQQLDTTGRTKQADEPQRR